jgi:nucleoid-associated protein YgaU
MYLLSFDFTDRGSGVDMSIRRLLLTATVMAGIGLLLHAVTPGWPELARALMHPQRLADTAGPDAVVLCLAGALAVLVWAWGVLGLVLTAAGTLPGAAGAAGRLIGRVVLPASARRATALVLGVGIGLGGPLLSGTALAAPQVATSSGPAVPDWPVATAGTTVVPDWPAPAPAGAHVVVCGDCLWTIAADRLQADRGRTPTDAETAAAVQAWWRVNAGVIGPDPDLLLPGQVLQAPGRP